MTAEQLTYYIERYLEGSITPGEWNILQEQMLQPESQQVLEELMEIQLTARDNAGITYPSVIERLKTDLLVKVQQENSAHQETIKHIPLYKRKWLRYAAAILILTTGSFIYYINNKTIQSPGPEEIAIAKNDIAPGTNRAVLTINNDQRIELDSGKNGISISGNITYNDGEKIASSGQLVQLATPRGGQWQATLPDGSAVWLNAASSIRFPSTFSEDERRVEVTGEAYFEIAKDATRPFKVIGGDQEIEVLGTSFNYNAYDDESIVATTLLQGSVKVSLKNGASKILIPGQQLQLHRNNSFTVTNNVNTSEVIAWKNGLFQFKNATVESIMKQVARWYDIELIIESGASQQIDGSFPRNTQLSNVLRILELTDKVRFKVDGKKVIVLQGY
jgi:transmembrane sensor